VDRAAMQRPFIARLTAKRAVKLILQDRCKKITSVREVRGHVILRTRIEIRFAAGGRGGDALVFLTQLPPSLVVVFRRWRGKLRRGRAVWRTWSNPKRLAEARRSRET